MSLLSSYSIRKKLLLCNPLYRLQIKKLSSSSQRVHLITKVLRQASVKLVANNFSLRFSRSLIRSKCCPKIDYYHCFSILLTDSSPCVNSIIAAPTTKFLCYTSTGVVQTSYRKSACSRYNVIRTKFGL